jgi:WD40 repeat protein
LSSGDSVVSASDDGTISVWSIQDGSLKFTLKDFDVRGKACSMELIELTSPDTIASCAGENKIKVWNLCTCSLVNTLSCKQMGISNLTLLRNGHLASVINGNEIGMWEVAGSPSELLRSFRVNCSQIISCLVQLADGNVAVGARNPRVQVWNADTGQQVRVVAREGEAIFLALLSDATLAVADFTSVDVFSLTGQMLMHLTSSIQWIHGLVALPDGFLAIKGKFWDVFGQQHAVLEVLDMNAEGEIDRDRCRRFRKTSCVHSETSLVHLRHCNYIASYSCDKNEILLWNNFRSYID